MIKIIKHFVCTVKTGTIEKNWTRPLLYIWKSLIDDEWERKTIRRHVEKKWAHVWILPALGTFANYTRETYTKTGWKSTVEINAADRSI